MTKSPKLFVDYFVKLAPGYFDRGDECDEGYFGLSIFSHGCRREGWKVSYELDIILMFQTKELIILIRGYFWEGCVFVEFIK